GPVLARGHQWHRRAARNDCKQNVPPSAYTSGMSFQKLAQRNAHGFFDVAWSLYMSRDAEQLCASVVCTANTRKPRCAAAQDVRRNRNRFHVVYSGRASVKTNIRRERRLQARLPLLAFQAFQQRRFLSANVGTGAVMNVEIEVPAMNIILADQLGFIGFVD